MPPAFTGIRRHCPSPPAFRALISQSEPPGTSPDQVILLQQGTHDIARDPKQLGGMDLVEAGVLECGSDDEFLEVGEMVSGRTVEKRLQPMSDGLQRIDRSLALLRGRHGAIAGYRTRLPAASDLQMLRPDDSIASHQYGNVNHVLQFSNVPSPLIGQQ